MSADAPKGSCYVWVITTFLFLSIISGGTFLVLYMTKPETPTTSWYPIVGIGLVCLPWFFWFLTCFYRLLSRTLGFRMVCWGTDVYPADSVHMGNGSMAGGGANDSLANGHRTDDGSAQGSRQVHFGGAVVLGEGGNNPSYGGSTASPRGSQESEMPLKLSMAS